MIFKLTKNFRNKSYFRELYITQSQTNNNFLIFAVVLYDIGKSIKVISLHKKDLNF